jgi:hypothetical protein
MAASKVGYLSVIVVMMGPVFSSRLVSTSARTRFPRSRKRVPSDRAVTAAHTGLGICFSLPAQSKQLDRRRRLLS